MSTQLTFEQLPNEIFHELFEYFDAYDLYRTFSHLNIRIDTLIENSKCLQVILDTPQDIDRRINQYLLPKIQNLIINHTKAFHDPIKPGFLSHIRYLTLTQPTREQFNEIQPSKFPYLERLHLIHSRFVYGTEQLCQLIFSNQFLNLRSCSIPHIVYNANNQWTSSSNIQSLQINIWDIRIYVQILNACPKLVHLKIQLSGGNIDGKALEVDPNKIHFSLRHLALCFSNSITCNLIDVILSFVPSLEYFSLNAKYQRPSDLPMDRLASILQYRTPLLNRIHICITLIQSLLSRDQINTNCLLFKSCKIQYITKELTKLLIAGSLI